MSWHRVKSCWVWVAREEGNAAAFGQVWVEKHVFQISCKRGIPQKFQNWNTLFRKILNLLWGVRSKLQDIQMSQGSWGLWCPSCGQSSDDLPWNRDPAALSSSALRQATQQETPPEPSPVCALSQDCQTDPFPKDVFTLNCPFPICSTGKFLTCPSCYPRTLEETER